MPIAFKNGKPVFSPGGKLSFACDSAEPCSFCNTGTTPGQLQVTISGMTDVVSGCVGGAGVIYYSALNATWLLDQRPGSPCLWETTYDDARGQKKTGYVIRVRLVSGTGLILDTEVPVSDTTAASSVCDEGGYTPRAIDAITLPADCSAELSSGTLTDDGFFGTSSGSYSVDPL